MSSNYALRKSGFKALGQTDKALECFDKGADAEPKNYVVFINRAELHQQQKKLQEALSDFSKAIEIQPDAPAPYLGRAGVYADLQMPDQAQKDLAKAAELKSKGETKNGP